MRIFPFYHTVTINANDDATVTTATTITTAATAATISYTINTTNTRRGGMKAKEK